MKKQYELTVNGLNSSVTYDDETVRDLFLPFLATLRKISQEKKRRVVAFAAAPPATGKSTLALFLQQLATEQKDFPSVQAIGLDGFHYHADYIKNNFVTRNGQKIPMQQVKGCPETFDAEKLADKLAAIREGNVSWPVYSRKIHDVIEDAEKIDGDIIILEGNWLLLKDERWAKIRRFADYALLIKAEAEILRSRLINRKIQGGTPKAEAEKFYEQSDRQNVERTLKDSVGADEIWEMSADGDYKKISD